MMRTDPETIGRLARVLKTHGVDMETGIGISIKVRTKPAAERLMAWIEQNNPTVEEICEEARTIQKEMKTALPSE